MLSKCKRCNAVFNRLGQGELCPVCEEEATCFARKVDDYLAHYPGRDAAAVTQATGVPRAFVVPYMDGQSPEEATLSSQSRCIRCGATPVVSGSHCQRCAIEVRQDVHQAVLDTQPPASATPRVVRGRRDTDSRDFRAVRYRYD